MARPPRKYGGNVRPLDGCREGAWEAKEEGIGSVATSSIHSDSFPFREHIVVASPFLVRSLKLPQNGDAPLRVLREMRAAGFRVCIDDFGTGYSSLSYLQELPVDAIKIGSAFVRDLDGGQRQRSIVRAIIRLAHELDLEVVAEGVESRGQLETLWSLGCDQVQGLFFAHPLAAAPMRAWLSQLP
jgi:predicted signal transduction protein with EAL and GGDEF domain